MPGNTSLPAPSRRGFLRGGAACGTAALLTLCGCGTPSEEPGPADAGSEPAAPATFEDCSWEELAAWSRAIEEAADEQEALAVAAAHGIVGEDGTICDQVRRFKLADDTVCEMRVVGLLHDEKADGSGKAGITLLCAEVPAERRFNGTDTVEGGWRDSELRAWLQDEGEALLPQELAALLVPVRKLSNNVGQTRDAASVTATDDRLWVPSVTEVVGTVDWYAAEYKDSAEAFDGVINAEGAQYRWFYENLMARRGAGEDPLARTYKGAQTGWWFRTVLPSSNLFDQTPSVYYVMDSGYPEGLAAPTAVQGVLFGLCL